FSKPMRCNDAATFCASAQSCEKVFVAPKKSTATRSEYFAAASFNKSGRKEGERSVMQQNGRKETLFHHTRHYLKINYFYCIAAQLCDQIVIPRFFRSRICSINVSVRLTR